MLRMLPRYPHKITSRSITEHLNQDNFSVSKRTVERDLQDLSVAFPLALDDREKPYGWSWQKDAPAFDLPGLGNHEALTLMLAEQQMKLLLPGSTLDVMAPYFKAARLHLKAIPKSNHMQSWVNKVRTVPPAQPLLAPPIKSDVYHVVTESLLSEKILEIRYRRRGETQSCEYQIHPLALIQRGGVIYLYTRFFEYSDTRLLAMHRIESATQLDSSATFPEGFSIDEEIRSGRLGFGDGAMIQLKAIFNTVSGEHLFETPLSADQKIQLLEEDQLEVTATVADTPQLLWWLLAMGNGVEVIEPRQLRVKVVATINAMANRYK